jgi:hypothetical protein
VTVMVAPGAALPATSVAVAVPVASVVPCVTVMLPALAANVTVAPLTAAFLESFATAVIVTGAEPSDGIVAALDETVTVVAVEPPGGVVVGVPMMVLEPPLQAASKAAALIQAMIDNLRMS